MIGTTMRQLADYLIDRNGDGFVDDISVRIVTDPDKGIDILEFWSRAIDLAARIGLEAQALPLPLFVPSESESESSVIRLRDIDDVEALLTSDEQSADSPAPVVTSRSRDLLDLFTIDGLLADADGDLLPDATSFGLGLPEEIPTPLGTALCNLVVRIGLESGGVTLPLMTDAEHKLEIRISDTPASLKAGQNGWTAEGDTAELAQLLNEISQRWPHFGQPETAGARYGVDWFSRRLAGRPDAMPVQWEMQWSAEPETQRLITTIERSLLPRLTADSRLDLVAFACEPLPVRRRMEQTLHGLITERGVASPHIRVLSAFKTGLSWLTEVVLPELGSEPVTRLEINYRRFEPPAEKKQLDLPIRWLQELFPGDEIAAEWLGLPVEDIVIAEAELAEAPIYQAAAYDAEGQTIGKWECDLLSYAMPFMPNVEGSEHVTVTTGGFIATIDGEQIAAPVDTDLDRFWRFWQLEVLPRLISEIRKTGGFQADRQPFFGALEVEVWLSAPNSRLGIREENDSAAEALHEDIYFNTLDTIEILGLNSTGDRTSAPGAVIPIVHVQPGVTPHAVVRLREAPAARLKPLHVRVDELWLEDGELVAGLNVNMDSLPSKVQQSITTWSPDSNDAAGTFRAAIRSGSGESLRLPLPRTLSSDSNDESPPMDQNIHGAAIEEWSARVAGAEAVAAWIEDYSYQGRPIPALALRSPAPGRVWSPVKLAILKPTALIVARHHANEISSTNAAFQLAHFVGHDEVWADLLKYLNIVVIPYENADGAALHARLAATPGAETWKHHPARYNVLGYEFSEDFHRPDTPYGESRVRPAIWRRWLPDVVVDNHGVPSHEWVQPFAGFGSPPRFRVSYWIPQALIYGIIRYVDDPEHPRHRETAMALRDAVSAAVRDTDIGDLNREIGASYGRWGQSRVPENFPGQVHDDMLWHIAETPPDPEGRGFNLRYPATTVLSWVTEVNDETARDEHLETVARAHLIANRAMLDLLVESDRVVERDIVELSDGRAVHRFKRRRPLALG